MKRSMIITTIIITVVLAGGLLAVATNKQSDQVNSSATNSTKVETDSAVATKSIAISDYKFSPSTVKVKVGDTVTWTNSDSVRHNIVADTASSAAPNGKLFGKSESFSYTFAKAGTYSYHCAPHPYMHGTVIVE